jgi:hypothetical protein
MTTSKASRHAQSKNPYPQPTASDSEAQHRLHRVKKNRPNFGRFKYAVEAVQRFQFAAAAISKIVPQPLSIAQPAMPPAFVTPYMLPDGSIMTVLG